MMCALISSEELSQWSIGCLLTLQKRESSCTKNDQSICTSQDLKVRAVSIYHLVMTNSSPWYRWPIEIDDFPTKTSIYGWDFPWL